MITITERAKKALLAKKLAAAIPDVDVGFRLTSAPDGAIVLDTDRAKPGDDVVAYRASTVLLVDAPTAAFVVAQRIVDCRRSEAGRLEVVLTYQQLTEHRETTRADGDTERT
jgi:hypothetical protein